MIGSAAMSCAYVASGQFDQYTRKRYIFVGYSWQDCQLLRQLEEITHLIHILKINSR